MSDVRDLEAMVTAAAIASEKQLTPKTKTRTAKAPRNRPKGVKEEFLTISGEGSSKRKGSSPDVSDASPRSKITKDSDHTYNLSEGIPEDYASFSEIPMLAYSQPEGECDAVEGPSMLDVDTDQTDKTTQKAQNFNQQKWGKIQQLARNWIDDIGADISSFVVMKLSFGKLDWGGHSCMARFVKDKSIVKRFLDAAQKQPSKSHQAKAPASPAKPSSKKGSLHDISTKDLSCAAMRHLISNICNKDHAIGFWKEQNRPSWWPDDVQFLSPNYVPGKSGVIASRMRSQELAKVLEAYRTNRTQSSDSKHTPSMSSDPSQDAPRQPGPSEPLPQTVSGLSSPVAFQDVRQSLPTKSDQAKVPAPATKASLKKSPLHGINTKDLSCVRMRHLIAEICNKNYVKGFWKETNKPCWWPADIQFISPNCAPSKSKVKRLKAYELVAILEAFKTFSKGSAKVSVTPAVPAVRPSVTLIPETPNSNGQVGGESSNLVFSLLPSSQTVTPDAVDGGGISELDKFLFGRESPPNAVIPLSKKCAKRSYIQRKHKTNVANLNRWKKIHNVAKHWVEKAGEDVWPFVVMKYSNGRLEWGGPAFMGDFVRDKVVLAKFVNAASRSHLHSPGKKTPAKKPPVPVVHKNIKDAVLSMSTKKMSVTTMRSLISQICNRKNERRFWFEENKPGWWPSDVPFISPNNVPFSRSDLRRMRVTDLMTVLDAYKKHIEPGLEKVDEKSPLPAASPCLSEDQTVASESPSKLEQMVSSLKMKNEILESNQKKWKKLKDMAHEWVTQSGDTVSSFIVMRLMPGKLEWEGPDFMEDFVRDTGVLMKFVNTALNRPSITLIPDPVNKLY